MLWSKARKAPTLSYPVVVRAPTGGLHYVDPVLNVSTRSLCEQPVGDWRIEYRIHRATCARCVAAAKRRGLVRGQP